MSDSMEPVRKAFEKARGPFRKRQAIMDDLKESDVGKARRSELAKEAADLDAQWQQALMALYKAMTECAAFMESAKKQ
jgi:hypothetical protein